MKRATLFLAPLLLLSFMGVQPAAARGFKVIVNRQCDVTSLSKKQVSRLFLKKVKSWDNDLRVLPVDLPLDSSARESFSKEVLGKAPVAVKAYWQQRVFSGRDVPPPEKDSDATVEAFVRTNPGAIGYVSADANVHGVKVVTIE
jgi:ABC-type phosphate transport system substrate-binding protein